MSVKYPIYEAPQNGFMFELCNKVKVDELRVRSKHAILKVWKMIIL